MLTLIAILLLILLGLGLLVAEIIFIPGTTLVGLLGLGFVVAGVFLGFTEFGTDTGTWILAGTAVVGIASVFISIRNQSWKKFSLNKSMKSRVNEDEVLVPVGARGVTISMLRPSGKADFDGRVFEVRTNGYQLEVGTPVRVHKIEDRTIYVEPLTIYQ